MFNFFYALKQKNVEVFSHTPTFILEPFKQKLKVGLFLCGAGSAIAYSVSRNRLRSDKQQE